MNLWRVFHIFFIVVSLAPVVLTVSRLIEIIRIAGRQRTNPRWAIHLWPSGFLARHSEAPADLRVFECRVLLIFPHSSAFPHFRNYCTCGPSRRLLAMAQDSDSALFGGMIDLGPVRRPHALSLGKSLISAQVSPTFASILAEPQTYQAEPITGSPVHAENTVVSSAQGSDASSSSAPPSPAAAAQGMGLLAPRNTAYNQPDTSPIEELLTLIDWQSDNHHAPKRVRGAPEKSHEKHVEHEKRRRNELASAIEEIDNLIPNTALGSASAKRTKLATLQEAAEYFKRVQDMACVLIRENRRLAASLRDQPAAPSPAALQSGPGIQRQECAFYIFFRSFFFFFPPSWRYSTQHSMLTHTRIHD